MAKGCKQRTSYLTKPVLEALEAHLKNRDGGYYLRVQRGQGHISTKQIQRLLNDAAEMAGLQEIQEIRPRKRIMRHFPAGKAEPSVKGV